MEMCNSLGVSRSFLLAGGGEGAAPHRGFIGGDGARRRCDRLPIFPSPPVPRHLARSGLEKQV